MKSFLIFSLFLGIFTAFIDAGDIECRFYEHHSNEYTCSVASLDAHFIERIYGNHQPGRSFKDVKFFTAQSRNLQFLPVNLHQKFPNLQYIVITSIEFREILKSDLEPFGENLKTLVLASTRLEDLPIDLFDANPFLGHLFIESKVFKHVDVKLFETVPRLYLLIIKFPCHNVQARNYDAIHKAIKNLDIRCYDGNFQHNYVNREMILKSEGQIQEIPPLIPDNRDNCYSLEAQFIEIQHKLDITLKDNRLLQDQLTIKNDAINKLQQCHKKCDDDFNYNLYQQSRAYNG